MTSGAGERHGPGCWRHHDRCALAAARALARVHRDQAAAVAARLAEVHARTLHMTPDQARCFARDDIQRARDLLARHQLRRRSDDREPGR